MAHKPSQPINQASLDAAARKAAYRFFENSKVSPARIIEPHLLSTLVRAQSYERLIVVQDTSFIDYTRHLKTTGLGALGRMMDGFEPQGVILHCALALTERGLPIGLLHHRVWSRSGLKEKDSHRLSLLPVEKKESSKWFLGLRETLQRTTDQAVTMVCDREADIYEFFEESISAGVDFVVRAQHARMLEDEDFGDINLFDRIAASPLRAHVQVEVPGSGKRPARQAKLAVKFLTVTYAAHPRGIKTKQVSGRTRLELNVVCLHEENPPKGEKAIHWTLITTLPVRKLDEALEVVRIYKMRWQIELYFKSLKTGCGVEDCRLASSEKLGRFIALQSVMAWRMLWITFINRTNPEGSCEEILSEDEWKTLWIKRHVHKIKSGEIQAKPPKNPPTIREAVHWIAGLGGFMGRKGDGEPGQITIWRGWLELMSAVEIYEVMK